MEIYKALRPKRFTEVLGQEDAIKSIEKLLSKDKMPHAILLTGPSGVGKTTIARILKELLHCSEQDFFEKNCADFRGIDDIREIRRHAGFKPMGGRCRIYLIDECHKLSNDAQNALLKLLEDTPRHVYFMLATTDPHKVIKTIHTRCSQIKLKPLDEKTLERVMAYAITRLKLKVPEEVVKGIIEVSEGSARKALVILEQVADLESEEEQLKAIESSTYNKEVAITLARALINRNGGWKEIAGILRAIEDQDAEGIRYCVLGYARACLLGGSKIAPRAYVLIDLFAKNFYDSKHAGLAAACWEAMTIQ